MNLTQLITDLIAAVNTQTNLFLGKMAEWNTYVKSKGDEVDSYLANADDKIRRTPFEIDTRGLDEDIYYPVMLTISAQELTEFIIFRTFNNPKDSGVSDHGCSLHFTAVGGHSFGNPRHIDIFSNHQTYIKGVGALGFGSKHNQVMMFIKGGYLYKGISSKKSQEVTIFTESTKYWDSGSDGDHLTIGPVDQATVEASVGVMPMDSSFVAWGDKDIKTLGGHQGT